ncbi:MAG TPA: alpha/beta hydrolase [Gammaproteobacteria bacterium]|nr:alpha/beta hydrolase [Gammaproteobacteria bacterium]
MIARSRLPGTPPPLHVWTTAEGLRLAADARGPEDGPQVLLLHGGGQTRHAWCSTGITLGETGYRAVAFDARGHGDSDWSPRGDYEQDAFVRDLVEVVRRLGDRRPVLIGASLGGNAALAAVGEGAVEISGLVLVDIVPQTERAGFERTKAFMSRHARGFATLEEVAEAIGDFRPGAKRSANPEGLAKNLRQGEDGRYYWHWDPRFLEGRERDFAVRHARLSAALKQVEVPVLLVRGGSSDVVSEEGVREFLALCPHAEYLNVLDAGHMITGDSNARFGEATMAFVARCLRSTDAA